MWVGTPFGQCTMQVIKSMDAYWHGSKRYSPVASSQPGLAGSAGGWSTRQNLDVTPLAVTCSGEQWAPLVNVPSACKSLDAPCALQPSSARIKEGGPYLEVVWLVPVGEDRVECDVRIQLPSRAVQ